MSHVVAIKTVPILNLAAAMAAAAELGGTFCKDQTTYKWFGRHVGDYALPEGLTADKLGTCAHAVHFEGINYELGLAEIPGMKNEIGLPYPDGSLFPLFDFWGSNGSGHDGHRLKAKIGEGAGKFLQCYAKHAAIMAAEQAGYFVAGVTTDDAGSIHLEIMVND